MITHTAKLPSLITRRKRLLERRTTITTIYLNKSQTKAELKMTSPKDLPIRNTTSIQPLE